MALVSQSWHPVVEDQADNDSATFIDIGSITVPVLADGVVIATLVSIGERKLPGIATARLTLQGGTGEPVERFAAIETEDAEYAPDIFNLNATAMVGTQAGSSVVASVAVRSVEGEDGADASYFKRDPSLSINFDKLGIHLQVVSLPAT